MIFALLRKSIFRNEIPLLNKDDADNDDEDVKVQPHFQGSLFPLLALGMMLAKVLHLNCLLCKNSAIVESNVNDSE